MPHEDWKQLLASASALRKAGRFDEARTAYETLLEIKPDLPDSWYNLGWLQRRAGQFDAALRSYQRALDLGISDPEEVHLNRAVILSDHLFQTDEAANALKLALATRPDFVPALLNLGNLEEDLGDRAAARGCYERILALEPGNALALARLAGVSHAPVLDEALATRLRAALERPGASAAERADLGFALANLLDAAGRHAQAFEVAAEANTASRAASGARYDRAAHERYVDRLIAAFDQPASACAFGAAPVFICGLWRSGSTLVEQMLARHSQVFAAGELSTVGELAQAIPDYPEGAPRLGDVELKRLRRRYLDALPITPGNGQWVTDKRPDNFLHIGLIKLLFPNAKIVHTRRDRRDNLLSLYFLHLDPAMAYALDLEDAAHWHGQYLRLMRHWKRLYPADIVDVDYDALVHDPRGEIEPVLQACGLPWEDGLLDFARALRPVKTASVWQVRQPLHTRSSGRWRNYVRELAPIID